MSRFTHWLLPARCLVCRDAGQDRRDLCAAELPVNDGACSRCGLPLVHGDPVRGACLTAAPPFGRTCAPFLYAFALDRLVPRVKFHEDLACGRLLAELCPPSLAVVERPQAMVLVLVHAAPRALPRAPAAAAAAPARSPGTRPGRPTGC